MDEVTSRLVAGVRRALQSLGVDESARAHDGTLAPLECSRAFAGDDVVLVRAGVPLGPRGEEHGPAPRDAVWLRLERRQEVRASALLGGEVTELRATCVELLAHEDHCCDAPRCEERRTTYEVVFVLEGEAGTSRFTVHEGGSRERAVGVAVALAERCGVPVDGGSGEGGAAHVPASEAIPALSAGELSQFILRREAGRWVVRHRASLGPRAALVRELAMLGALIAALFGSGMVASVAWHHGAREKAAIALVCGVVAAVAAYAVAHIARHSASYRAEGAPILVAFRDRVVPSPWVSRAGEISLTPEGRYGAGLAVAGVEELRVEVRGDACALILETDHGPYELARFGSEAAATLWRRALLEVFERVRHVALVCLFILAGLAPSACGGTASEGASTPDGVMSSASRSVDSRALNGAASAASIASASASPAASVTAEPPAPPPAASPEARVNAALPAIEDDVPAALEVARVRGVPVLVDVWAAWCHTCLSMKSYVLTDPRVAALASEIVFATVDGENERNAAFLEAHRPGVWPTFFVLDARDGAVLGAWEGSASADELVRFVRGAASASSTSRDPAVAALIAGSRAAAAGRCEEAIRHHTRALKLGGDSFSRRGEAVKGLLYCQRRLGRYAACAATGSVEVPRLDGASTPADAASTLLECAAKVADTAARDQAIEVAIGRLRRAVTTPDPGATVDDRSDALAILAGALRGRGDRAEASRLVSEQRRLLEEAAAAAPSPEARAAFDYARMNVYLAAGEAQAAIAMLTQRAAELPDHYEPRARLAQVLASVGQDEAALSAIDGALELLGGPRRIRYLTMKADLLARLGRPAMEREAVAELVRAYEALPPARRREPPNVAGLTEARSRLRRLR